MNWTPNTRFFNMDSKYVTEMYKLLEKQNQGLMEAYRSMSHEVHRLQVEEEMLMHKFYELMTAEKEKKKNREASPDDANSQSGSLVCDPSNGGSTAESDVPVEEFSSYHPKFTASTKQ